MKKKDWIFLISLVTYAYLFWQQEPGVNFFIMTCVLVAGQLMLNTDLVRVRKWLIVASAALITSFCVAWYGNVLSVLANFTALLAVAGFTLHRRNSWLVATGLVFISAIAAPAFIIVSFVNRMNSVKESKRDGRSVKRLVIVLIVFIIALIFFVLYRGSSILFESLTNSIDTSFISFGWCMFITFGAVALFGFYKQQKFTRISSWDGNQQTVLLPSPRVSFLDKIMSLDNEYFSGVLLLGILNLMLITVNTLDVVFQVSGAGFLPESVTYSQYVHQGIGVLILSIICATLIILFYFRNYHVSSGGYKMLKWLALLWVLQNIFMVITTIHLNHGYIYVFGLSYKRIGVDVFLVLAMFGLLLVTWKVMRQKSLAYILRSFGWAIFVIFVFACPINWDHVILDYNTSLLRRLDMVYLNELSSTILLDQHNYSKTGYQLTQSERNGLGRKTVQFLNWQRDLRDKGNWQSYTFAHLGVYDALCNIRNTSKDSVMQGSYSHLKTVFYFPFYRSVSRMELRGNQIANLGEIAMYGHLEYLDLQYNYSLVSLEGIEYCTSLKELNVMETGIYDFTILKELPNLQLLRTNTISANQANELKEANPFLSIQTH